MSLRVLAVTSWGTACGIAAYMEMLKEAVEQADPTIQIEPRAEALDPGWLGNAATPNVLYLNYHRGLHSRWTPEVVQSLKDRGSKVVITFHDTRGEEPPDPLQLALHDLADAFVVHEPCEGLPKAIYLRQGVPDWPAIAPFLPTRATRSLLGTVGWNFPWKNYDKLAEVTTACGWDLLICCNNATPEDRVRWERLNPRVFVKTGFLQTSEIVSLLASCDATAFCYECANTGTSGAIRLGIAARKPVIAFRGCRQNRDLLRADAGYWTSNYPAIRWIDDFDGLAQMLARVPIQRCDPGIAALAHRDSWTNQGRAYADIFRRVVAQ